MKIALIGYGKMGKAIERIALSKEHEISQIIKAEDELGNLLEDRPEVAIEFTQPESVFGNLSFCIEHNIPVITGTTGWLDRYDEIAELCKEKNGTFLHASNFSIGVNLFFELNEWLATKMANLDFENEIEEIHHTEKKDSPSGTAITLADGILKGNKKFSSWTNEKSTDHTKLGIISKRIPNVPGTHTVSYSSNLESIKIEHIAHDRSVFAQGAVLVGEWIKNKKGIFSMSDFINQ